MLGYPITQDMESGRIYVSATGERVRDEGKQQILGTVDGKIRGVDMRMARKKSHMSAHDMMAGHRVVFDAADNAKSRQCTRPGG